ncbi:unnamed protein product [Microthlaspi erraticum]|uniref:Uncharacterized protein n=1 Tax=Microthlaspi erraticum TaxID=1685480 RepID=A0A6D2II91_9BRAS|nr:unnamed protein product [Microthlaspi erraticum]
MLKMNNLSSILKKKPRSDLISRQLLSSLFSPSSLAAASLSPANYTVTGTDSQGHLHPCISPSENGLIKSKIIKKEVYLPHQKTNQTRKRRWKQHWRYTLTTLR